MLNIVRKIRKEKKISQKAFAKLIGTSRPTLVKIEEGTTEPRQSEIKRICEVLEIPIDDFMNNRLPSKITINIIKQTETKQKKDIQIDIPQENIDKIKEVILYILNEIGAKPTINQPVIYMLLYFIDFDYYEKFKEQITGTVYIKSYYGLIPAGFNKIIEDMERDNDLEQVKSQYYEQIKYIPNKTADLSRFNGREIKHIDKIICKLEDKTLKELNDLLYKNASWIAASEQEPIKYEISHKTKEERP